MADRTGQGYLAPGERAKRRKKLAVRYFRFLLAFFLAMGAGDFISSEEILRSLQIEVLLNKNIARNELARPLIPTFDISPDKLILFGTSEHLYYLGWGGLLKIQNSLAHVHSFAYTRDGSLLLIKDNFLYSIDEGGKNFIPFLELPVPNMRIANSPGADQVYLYECQAMENKISYGLFVLFPDMSYKKILESPEPIESVADMEGPIFFATGSAVYEIDISRQMRLLVAAPPEYQIRAIATDIKKNIIYFSDLHSIYAYDIKNEIVSEVLKTTGGYLKYFADSLFVFNPEQWLLIRLVERSKAFSFGMQEQEAERKNSQYLFEQGYKLYSQAKFNKAVEYLDKALAIETTHLLAWCYEGMCFMELKRWDEAMSAFNSALNINKECALALAKKSFLLRRLKNKSESDSLLSKAVSIQPKENDAFGYYGRGIAHFYKRNYRLAIEDYSSAIKIDPYYFEAYKSRGLAYIVQGKSDIGIADYNSALNIYPQFASVLFSRGGVYMNRHNYKLAIADFDSALNINPQYEAAYDLRGCAFIEQGQYDLAIESFNSAILINPKYENAYSNRGRAYLKQGKHNLAMEDFNFSIKINPEYALGYLERGLAYYTQGKYDSAIEDFSSALSIIPQYAWAYYRRGLAYAAQSKYDLAKKDFEKAIELDQGGPTAKSAEENLRRLFGSTREEIKK